jgi:hypothetical protein
MSKNCTKCKQIQEIDQFPKHKHYKDGLSSWCRKCLRSNTDAWEVRNKERKALKGKQWQSRNPRSRANSKFKDRYGITIDIYDKMVLKQNGQCAICHKNAIDNLKGKLFVDHCHETSVVRGLLCHECNSGIGNFKDNIELLIRAVKYLVKTTKITGT